MLTLHSRVGLCEGNTNKHQSEGEGGKFATFIKGGLARPQAEEGLSRGVSFYCLLALLLKQICNIYLSRLFKEVPYDVHCMK